MTQYIDKAAVVAKIQKRFDEYTSSIFKHYDACKEARAQELGKILTIINAIEAKEVNLEEEIYNAEKRFGDIDEMGGYRILLFDDEFRDILRYFFELGLKTQKGE